MDVQLTDWSPRFVAVGKFRNWKRERVMRKFGPAVLAVLLVAATAAAQTTVTVNDNNLNGWSFVPYDGCGGVPTDSTAFVTGPGTPPAGEGSLEIVVGTNGNSSPRWWLNGYSGTTLASITELSYWTYVDTDVDNQAVYLRLYIDTNGDTTVDDSIYFEPAYQHAVYGGTQDPPANDVWQEWDGLTGNWYSNNGAFGSGPGVNVMTWAETLACFPTGRIMDASTATINGGISFQAGCGSVGWPNFDGNVDAFRITTATSDVLYDFEENTADLTVDKEPAGPFENGTGSYTVVVTNVGPVATDGSLVTVTDTPAFGVTVTGMSGTGWTCDVGTRTCTRSDVLAAGASYPPILVDVAYDTSPVSNTASVSGGGDDGGANDADTSTVEQAVISEIPSLGSFGLVALALLLGAVALVAMRGRIV